MRTAEIRERPDETAAEALERAIAELEAQRAEFVTEAEEKRTDIVPTCERAEARAELDGVTPSVLERHRRATIAARDRLRQIEKALLPELDRRLEVKRRELAEARQAEADAAADAAHAQAEQVVTKLVEETQARLAPLLPFWDAAKEADQRARRAALAAGRGLDTGDGVWRGQGPIRALMLELERFAKHA